MIHSFLGRFTKFFDHPKRSIYSLVSLEHLANQRSRRKVRKFYAQFINPGDLCFDIGAHVGNRTDVFLALGARVVCVEPQPKCVVILTEKYAENSEVIVVPKGIAAQPGIRSLYLCKSASTIATFSEKWKTGRFRDYSWESAMDVSVTTLDALIQEFGVPTFCKIDVEGFEYQVLQGLSSPIPALSFEFTKEFINDAKLCMDYLVSLGDVEFNYVLAETPALVLSCWADANTLLSDLRRVADDVLWGDIYARFQSSPYRTN